jgi:predicted house-cleaning noncanonical NTP pyrophosphatase (MazG superfamily)
MTIKKYNKLIRDKIPQIIEQSGKKAIVEQLNADQYITCLNSKLNEELDEYLESGSVEELADLVEVVYAILDFKNVSISEFERIREEKVEKRGAFKQRLLLKEVIED